MNDTQIYLFNGKKVQIQDSRRTGEDINYVYMDESGVRASISCSVDEFEEYFTPTAEQFKVNKHKDPKEGILYDVVYVIGNRVMETIKFNLPKGSAFGFRQWAVKQAVPGGQMSNYRASGIEVRKALDNKKPR